MLEIIKENLRIIIFIALVLAAIVGYYFYTYRRFMKQREKFLEFQESLKVNDEIVMSSGILGKIVKLNDKTAIIESANSRILVNRYSINAKKG